MLKGLQSANNMALKEMINTLKKNLKKTKLFVDKWCLLGYNSFALNYGGVAQLVRAFGSYPKGQWFESTHRYQKTLMVPW